MSTKRKYNKRKEAVLEFLVNNPGSLVVDIAGALDMEITNAADTVWRLSKQQLVDRHTVPSEGRGRRRYSIRINATGLRRLQYYQGEQY